MPTAIKIRLPATFKQQLTTKQLKSNFLLLILLLLSYLYLYIKRSLRKESIF